jgi:50S ribosomal protein L16 3-hydroxylase
VTLTECQIRQFVADGFLVLPSLIRADDTRKARDIIWSELSGLPDDPTTWPAEVIVSLDSVFDTFRIWRPEVLDSTIESLVGGAFVRGDGLTPVLNFPRFGPPQTQAYGFHIDGLQETTLFPGRRYLVVVVYLNNVVSCGGAVVVLPGSHRQIFDYYERSGRGPNGATEIPQDIEYAPPLALHGPPGTVLLLHYLLAHGGSANHSVEIREALVGRVRPLLDRHHERRLAETENEQTPLSLTLRPTDRNGIDAKSDVEEKGRMPARLESLTTPVGAHVFRRDYWPGLPFVQHGPLERFGDRPLALSRLDPGDVLARLERPVVVYGQWPLGVSGGLSDRLVVAPATAIGLFAKGDLTLEIDYFELEEVWLREWIADLRDDLGLPSGTVGKAVLYYSTNAAGLSGHFDAYANFVVQLRGEKTWIIAPNRSAENPLEHFDIDEGFASDELMTYWRGPLLGGMPGTGTTERLSPGSMLFLPRGYWHSTTAGRESLSINLTFSQTTWLDLALSAVRSRLVRHNRWRELADGLGSTDPIDRHRVARQAGKLAKVLYEDLGPIDADELVRLGGVVVDSIGAYKAAVATWSKL